MNWRDIYIERDVGAPALARGLASAFGIDPARAGAAGGGGLWPEWVDGCEVWAGTWPTRGDAQLMAHLFLNRDEAEVERLDDRATMQALADALGCAVLLPDEGDPYSDNYWRLWPHRAAERVALDPYGPDEDPPRVMVTGPAAAVVPEPGDLPDRAAAAE